MVAYVEETWADAVSTATLYRYELPPESFESLDDAGMWVSKSAVRPLRRAEIGDLADELSAAGVELRTLPDLTPLKDVWNTSLHASGIRLRNAVNWNRSDCSLSLVAIGLVRAGRNSPGSSCGRPAFAASALPAI